jgi:uncharacterized BrkB/YihY/UPF0761 family membrane protein
MPESARWTGPLRATWLVLVDSFKAFAAAEPFRLAAALSYYSLLSMAPLLLIVIGTAGFFFGEGTVRNELIEQIRTLTGEEGASLVETVIDNTDSLERSAMSIVLGGGLMLFGATTVFAQLQGALNEIWRVKAAPANAILGRLGRKKSLQPDRQTQVQVYLLRLRAATVTGCCPGNLGRFRIASACKSTRRLAAAVV